MANPEPRFPERLQRAAEAAGLSWAADSHEKRIGSGDLPLAALGELLETALGLVGDALVGAVLFGSWVRGEAGPGSDLDVLLVLDPSFPLTRELYRKWDRSAFRGEDPLVEVHFVHLPRENGRLSAFWAEVAMDGLVLLDGRGRIGEALREVRRRIAAGELVRREIDGRSYWVEAA